MRHETDMTNEGISDDVIRVGQTFKHKRLLNVKTFKKCLKGPSLSLNRYFTYYSVCSFSIIIFAVLLKFVSTRRMTN